jgi:hypothetical protein
VLDPAALDACFDLARATARAGLAVDALADPAGPDDPAGPAGDGRA